MKKGEKMQIERFDGTKEKREYANVEDMMQDAVDVACDPNTKKLVLHFPKKTIPKKRRRK